MGEAKRRQNLDPDWGKGKALKGRTAARLVEAGIANEEWQNPEPGNASLHHRENLESVVFGLMLREGVKSIGLPGLSKHQTESLNKVCKTLAGFVLQDPNHSLSAERSPFIGENETATREAGKTLNDIGGFSLMVQVAEMIVPPCDRRELECVWHGIGEWKA